MQQAHNKIKPSASFTGQSRRIITLFTLCLCFLFSAATPRTGNVTDSINERRLRDSVFQVIHSQPLDSLRLVLTSKLFQRYFNSYWAVEIADSGLSDALKLDNHKKEMDFRYDLLRYAHSRGDLKQTEQYMQAIKEPGYRYKMYEDYFMALHGYLSLQCARGNIEFVIRKAHWMEEEAIRLDRPSCLQTSYLVLINAYRNSGDNERAIQYCYRTLDIPKLSISTRLTLYSFLSQIYYKLKRFEENETVLRSQYAILDSLIRKDPVHYVNYENRFLENALGFCKIRIAQKDCEGLRRSLEEAKRHYDEGAYFSYYLSYHDCRAAYFAMLKDWEHCQQELDLSLARCNGQQPLRELETRSDKACYLQEAGHKAEAVALYKEISVKFDSLLRDIRHQQQETVVSNYSIRKHLLDKEENQKKINLISTAFGILLFLFLAGTAIYQLFYHKRLRRTEAETREATLQIKQANKMKEVFLKNIIGQVQPPLHSVVELSRKLSSHENLPQELRQEYSQCIKTSTTQLIDLINNILDLSRLEAGMMRFNVQPCDVVQLCRDSLSMLRMQNPDSGNIPFESNVSGVQFATDSERFLKMLISLMTASEGENSDVILLQLIKTEHYITLTVTHTPLAHPSISEQQNILNEINRLFVKAFNGSYGLYPEETKAIIKFKRSETLKRR